MSAWGAVARQFGRPSGPLGAFAALVMTLRPSNRLRNALTLDLLDIRPGDWVLEIGFGPGLAVAAAARLATAGHVVGIDHSDLMVAGARRRNAREIANGRVELVLASADALPPFPRPFDKVFAVNVYMFWKEPVAILGAVRRAMAPGGSIALTLQPRRPGATRSDAASAAEAMGASLQSAGFGEVRAELLEMAPVPAACARARS